MRFALRLFPRCLLARRVVFVGGRRFGLCEVFAVLGPRWKKAWSRKLQQPSVERGRIFDAWEHLHVGRGMSDPNAHSLAGAKRQEKVKNEISRASLIMMIETAVTNETSIKETADTSSWIRALLPDNVTLY